MYKCARAHTHQPKPVLIHVCRSFTCHAPVILFKLTKKFDRRTKKLFTSTDNCRWSNDNLFTQKSLSQKLELFYIKFFFDIWCMNALRQTYVHCIWTHTHTNEKKNLQENISLRIENINNKPTNTKIHKSLSIPNFLNQTSPTSVRAYVRRLTAQVGGRCGVEWDKWRSNQH